MVHKGANKGHGVIILNWVLTRVTSICLSPGLKAQLLVIQKWAPGTTSAALLPESRNFGFASLITVYPWKLQPSCVCDYVSSVNFWSFDCNARVHLVWSCTELLIAKFFKLLFRIKDTGCLAPTCSWHTRWFSLKLTALFKGLAQMDPLNNILRLKVSEEALKRGSSAAYFLKNTAILWPILVMFGFSLNILLTSTIQI